MMITGWWFGTWIYFPQYIYIYGTILPIDFQIFQRGWNHQPVMWSENWCGLNMLYRKDLKILWLQKKHVPYYTGFYGYISFYIQFSDRPMYVQ